jgi:rsbT co-antagonist protein RsbR
MVQEVRAALCMCVSGLHKMLPPVALVWLSVREGSCTGERAEEVIPMDIHLQTTTSLAREWEQRKTFVGFTDAEAQLLLELGPIAETYVDEVVEGLYRQFLSFGETRAFFPDDATLKRVKALQRAYFLQLTQGDYGEAYLAHRLHIGQVHQQIGLEPRWYMGAYSIYMQLAFPRVMAAYKHEPDKGQRMFLALLKIITLDTELAITTYIAAGEEVISRQSREILEISTPVVQVWAGVLVTPLIGTLDTERAQLFTERLLERVVEMRTSVVLVDITGVPTMDTRTAQHLTEAISAVRLLGAQVLLTGVRPAIAQTLVHLGIDLSNVATRPSLEAGLRLALDMLDFQVTNRNGKQ